MTKTRLNFCRYSPVRRTGAYFVGGTPYRQFLSQYGGTLTIYDVQKCHKYTRAHKPVLLYMALWCHRGQL